MNYTYAYIYAYILYIGGLGKIEGTRVRGYMEGLKIKLGNVKYHDHNGKRFLSFNVYAQWGEDFALLINGFRLLLNAGMLFIP
jgi:hypothetical protein